MLPCQGRCREFEPRLPLIKKECLVHSFLIIAKQVENERRRDTLAVVKQNAKRTDKVHRINVENREQGEQIFKFKRSKSLVSRSI